MTTNRRVHWILISFLLFFGIFVGSITCRVSKGAHVPQRAASRAIGANASLVTAVREQDSTPSLGLSFIVLSLLLTLVVSGANIVRRRRSAIRGSIRSSLWLPPLLFRPPPVFTVA